jgi:hypothetical protein
MTSIAWFQLELHSPLHLADPLQFAYLKLKIDLFNTQYKVVARVGRYFDILMYRNIFNRDYRIEGRNLSNDISKLSSCLMSTVILLHMCI